ncbi:hypothetical protein FB451DRAFT_1552620 [Mycena latifolia]|nr:hypothetical protein FB451DRAFT_1552620 [Mycena latifolia]
MSILLNTIIDAATRGWNVKNPASCNEIRSQLEWSWGLGYETLDAHVNQFSDSHLEDIVMDDTLILLAHPDIVHKFCVLISSLPFNSRGSRQIVQELYGDSKSFEYLVLPVDPSSKTTPRLLISSVPPHLTISTSADKLLKRWGYSRSDFMAAGASLIALVETSPPTGATFSLNRNIFVDLKYIHERWASCYVSPTFLGLERSDDGESDSTMEWEVQTMAYPDEPCRRMLPHEFEQEPVVKIRQPPVDDDDDAISQDSHITGADNPEAYAKASMERADEADRSWLKGIESWAESAEGVDDALLLNDGQIEEDSKEGPRVATSMDLDKADYLTKPKLLSRLRTRASM